MSAPAERIAPPAMEAAAHPAAASARARVETALATVFGLTFMALAVVVTVETLSRKLFNVSLQGADELGGYALALGSTIAFSLALMGRSHIRVDVFHSMMGRRAQAAVNWLAMLSLAAFGIFIAVVAFKVIADTLAYRSTAPTPWQTPLIWPQSVWYAGLVVFALLTLAFALRATGLLFAGRVDELNHEFPPRSVKEELREELNDLAQRQGQQGANS